LKPDLKNYIDPKTLDDSFERVKFEFPFYRTNIIEFGQRLDDLNTSDAMKVNELKTYFVSIKDVH
jgi:hypothetical protein